MRPLSATLLIQAPDRRGLVAAIAGFLAQHDANILDLSQHADPEGLFFARVVFDLDGLALDRNEVAPAFTPLARRFEMTWQLFFSDTPKRMGILVSKYGHCLADLLYRHQAQELPLAIPLVLSNHADMAPLCEFYQVPFKHCPLTPDTKCQQETRMRDLLKEAQVDFIVMARYMQVLSADFLAAFPLRVINIHHSFLPAFTGGKPYHQAYARGVKLIGATSHYATEALDEGPIIEQDVARVHHGHDPAELVLMGRDIERVVLARAVRLAAENRILVAGRRTVIFN